MITAYVDGGARGNPGPAGYGAYIVDEDGTVLAELFAPLGRATNNVAEYNGLLAALRWALEHGVSRLHVRAARPHACGRLRPFRHAMPLKRGWAPIR